MASSLDHGGPRRGDGPAVEHLLRGLGIALGIGVLASASERLLGALLEPASSGGRSGNSIAWWSDVPVAGVGLTVVSVLLAGQLLVGRVGRSQLVQAFVLAFAMNAIPTASALVVHSGTLAITNALLLTIVVLAGYPALIVAGAGIVTLLLLRSGLGGEGIVPTLDLSALNLGLVLSAWPVVRSFSASASTADDLAADLERIELRARLDEAEESTRDVVRRVLHDEVISALRAVAEPGSLMTAQVVARVRSACAGAVTAVEMVARDRPAPGARVAPERGEQTEAAARVAELIRRRSPIEVVVRVVEGRVPPDDVVAALVESAAEALRNVERHAGVDIAQVGVDFSSGGTSVTVADLGVGLTASSASGFGITSSIVGRMEQVSGTAVFGSGPAGGTTVTLTWSPAETSPAAATLDADTAYTVRERRRMARGLTLPMLTADLYLATRYVPTSPSPVLQSALALGMVAMVLLLVRVVPRGRPTQGWIAVTVVVQTALCALHIGTAGPGAVGDFRSWGVGTAQLPLILLAFFTPLRVLPVLVLPTLGVLVADIHLDPAAHLTGSLGALTSVVPTVLSGVLGAYLRWSRRLVGARQRQLIAATVADRRRDYLVAAREHYLRHVDEVVVPWLKEVADGMRDPVRRTTRAEASVLGQSVRDDLYAPGFFSVTLRAAVTQFRAQGGMVLVRPGFEPGASERLSGSVLADLVRDVVPGRRVTLTATGAEPPTVRVVVTPPLTSHEVVVLERDHAHSGLHVDGDEYASILLLPDLPTTGDGATDGAQGKKPA